MSATYDQALLTAKDRMRLQLGDTNFTPETQENALRTDEEYVAALNAKGNELAATIYLAEGLAAQFGQEPDSIGSDGDLIRWGERVDAWLEVAKRLRAQSTLDTETAIAAARGARSGRVGLMRGIAPSEAPTGYPDHNSGYYRGEPNTFRRRW